MAKSLPLLLEGSPCGYCPLPAALMGKLGKPRILLNKLNRSFSIFPSKAHNEEKLSEPQSPVPVLYHMDNFLYIRPVGIYNALTSLAQISSIKKC